MNQRSQTSFTDIIESIQRVASNLNRQFQIWLNESGLKRLKLKKNAYLLIGGFVAFIMVFVFIPASIRMMSGMNQLKMTTIKRGLYQYNNFENKESYLQNIKEKKNNDVLAKSSLLVIPVLDNPVVSRIKASIPQYITEKSLEENDFITQLAISKQIVIYFFPYQNMELFYSFYDNIVLRNGLWNIIIYVTVPEVFDRLKLDRIPVVLLKKSEDDQGTIGDPLSSIVIQKISAILEDGYSVTFIGADVSLVKPLPRSYSCYDCDIHVPSFPITNLAYAFIIFHPTIMTLSYMHELQKSPSLLIKLYEAKEDSGIITEILDTVVSGATLFDMYNIYKLDKENDVAVVIHNDLQTESDKLFRMMDMNLYTPLLPIYYNIDKKLLIYENPFIPDQPDAQELRLLNAIKISRLLNRVLVLPMFNCGDSVYSFTMDPHVQDSVRKAFVETPAIKLDQLIPQKTKISFIPYIYIIFIIFITYIIFIPSSYYAEFSYITELEFRTIAQSTEYFEYQVINLSGLNEYKLDNIRVYDNLLFDGIIKRFAI
ncbi:hypothetical protein WA158_003109 [Blastocystis sp. Blastoise]